MANYEIMENCGDGNNLPSADRARSCLIYNDADGSLVWSVRADMRPQWNGRYAGKKAGYIAGTGYRMIELDGFMHLAHRLTWLIKYGDVPEFIDHANGDRSDNRLSNLRSATRSQNGFNQKVHNDGTSGYKGVSWAKWAGCWESYIRLGKKKKRIGYFASKLDAALAYDRAARSNFGEYAKTNF